MKRYKCFSFVCAAVFSAMVYAGNTGGTESSQKMPERTFRNRYGMLVNEFGGGVRTLKRETALKAVIDSDVYEISDVLEEYKYVPDRILPESYGRCVSRVVEYKDAGRAGKLRMEAELPLDAAGPVPYIIWIHGGGWHGGSPASMKEVSRFFASSGFASFRVQYRLRGDAATNEDQLQDIADAVAYIKANAEEFNVKPDVYAYIGGSAGGQLALISGINDSECDAIVPMYAVYDIKGFYEFLVSIGQRNEMDDVVKRFFIMEEDDRYAGLNPCDAVKKDMPPTLVLHGTGDSTAPYAHCEHFMAKMEKCGNVFKKMIFENYEHNFTGKGASDVYEKVQFAIRDFLFEHLKCRGGIEESIRTEYPTKDWVISDFVVTDDRFGARAEPGFDNTKAFQAAIDAAYESGGGVVYVPAGNYEFSSVQVGEKLVRIRRGDAEEKKEFDYNYVLKLHPGVQLRGDWADPSECGGKVKGTILEVRAGKDAPGYDRSIESWWNDSQAGNALRTSYTSIADRFIEMNAGTGVTNLSIWYPEQDADDIKPYPWTLFQTYGDCATVENVTLVNSYNGFYSAPSELHYIRDSYMTALCKGIEIHVCTDIGRLENVRISPEFWAGSGLPGAPSYDKLEAYTKRNGIGFQMHRSDWEYISYLSVSGYKTGVWIGREPGFDNAPNAQLYGIDVQNCSTGLYVEDVNPYGIMVSNSSIGSGTGELAVYFYKDFDTSVQFNGVRFTGPIVSDGNGGVVSFENCSFDRYDDYALKINSGNVILTQSAFCSKDRHLYIGESTSSVKAVNSGFGKHLAVKNESPSAEVQVVYDKKYKFDPIPVIAKTDIDVYPRPVSSAVLKADLPSAKGYNNDVPQTDVSWQLQKALDELKESGGGTLFLPAGRYLVDNPIIVPSGVELRGSWDVQHHTQSGGTAIFTTYTGGPEGKDGEPLIRLETNAGIKGLTIAQLNLVNDDYSIENPQETPFLIQGRGRNVYVINVTIALGDKGIDLATYDTGGHYVEYLGGVLLRAGIWVGGGSEGGIIRNMQFNPHYSLRLPRGGQGYPKVASKDFVQSHCSALKFADVRNQTIFNNFVFGSVYGIHFLKDAITGKCPGQIEMVGHGSDGCTFALFVEDAGKDTRITGINSELVNTRIVKEPMRAYVLMGSETSAGKVHPKAELVLYNSAFWGSPVIGAIVNNGTVKFRQANFCSPGNPAIDLRCGTVEVFSSYFPQKGKTFENMHLDVKPSGRKAVLVNNYYGTGLRFSNKGRTVLDGPDFR